LIGGLKDIGIPLDTLVKDIEVDLRDSLCTMLTAGIADHFFKRILFFEIKSLIKEDKKGFSLADIFENLYISLIVLEKKNYIIKRIALPFIGTGKQKIPVEDVAGLLPGITEKFLTDLKYLEKVTFIDKDESKVRMLSDQINERLGRPDLMVAKDVFGENLRINIVKKISELQTLTSIHGPILQAEKKVFSDSQLKGYEVAISGRKILEIILNLITKSSDGTLAERIYRLDTLRIANWIKSYMHMIRIFGNEMAHPNVMHNQIPSVMSQEDILLNLVCIERTLDFAYNYIQGID
jgi:hypothetical protein